MNHLRERETNEFDAVFFSKFFLDSLRHTKKIKLGIHRTARTLFLSATVFINIYVLYFFIWPFYRQDILVSPYFYHTFIVLPVCLKRYRTFRFK